MSPKETSLDRTLYSIVVSCEHCGAMHDRPEVVCACGALLVKGLQPGAVIVGRYKYLATIGNGGMGLIVKAYDPQGNCDVALKLLLRNNNSAEVQRFMRECEATDALSHECIIKVKEHGVTNDGFPFMAMEFLPGDDLGTVISRQGALDVGEAIEIFEQICKTMSYAHSKGVVHRDIKPSNIMLPAGSDNRRKIKIVDFGIAKVMYPDDTGAKANLTQTGQVIGSPMYMSPEQALGKKIDHRTDIYSAACVLYHALTGAPPIQGESAMETLFKHVNEVPISMSEASLGKTFPPALEQLVAKAMKKDPAERYQSFDEMKRDLLQSDDRRPVASALKQGSKAEKPETKKTFPVKAAVILGTVLACAVAGLCLWATHSHGSAVRPKQPAASARPSEAGKSDNATEPRQEAELDPNQSPEVAATEEIMQGRGSKELIDLNLRTNANDVDLCLADFDDRGTRYLIERIKATNAQVYRLQLNKTRISDESMKLLAEGHVPLRDLSVQETQLTEKGLNWISQMSSLRKLDISHDHSITPSAFKNLGKLKRLTELNMDDVCNGCKEQDFAFLSYLTELKFLRIDLIPLPAGVFRYAEKLPLNTLQCKACGLTDKSLEYIGNIGALEDLRLLSDSYTDSGVANLDDLTGLVFLEFGGKNLTNKSLPSFAKLRNLKALHLTGMPKVTDQEIAMLQKQMSWCKVTRTRQ